MTVWAPLLNLVVDHCEAHPSDPSVSVLTAVASTAIVTFVTPTLSVGLVVMVLIALTVVPFVGAVIVTFGGVVSLGGGSVVVPENAELFAKAL